jgi:uncharacterized membrane protein YdbT with pleckstrin-like domain
VARAARRGRPVLSRVVDPEPGEVIFFHGHPSWRSILAFYVRGLIGAVLAGALAGLVTAVVVGHVQAGWVVLVVLAVFAFTLIAGLLRRIVITYSITNQRLTIERGLFSRELHETRLERVQNVNSSQGPLERLLRVGTVNFDTAASAAFDFSFHGVSDPKVIVRTVDRALRERTDDGDVEASAGV